MDLTSCWVTNVVWSLDWGLMQKTTKGLDLVNMDTHNILNWNVTKKNKLKLHTIDWLSFCFSQTGQEDCTSFLLCVFSLIKFFFTAGASLAVYSSKKKYRGYTTPVLSTTHTTRLNLKCDCHKPDSVYILQLSFVYLEFVKELNPLRNYCAPDNKFSKCIHSQHIVL